MTFTAVTRKIRATMNMKRLPVHIDPFRAAERQQQFAGTIKLSALHRLCDSLISSDGEVYVEMAAGKDPVGTRFMRGYAEVTVEQTCQRCMHPFTYPLRADFLVGICRNDVASALLAENYEPLIVEEDSLFLADFIEDELLLALPIVARHTSCEVAVNASNTEDKMENVVKSVNPFAQLQLLKK